MTQVLLIGAGKMATALGKAIADSGLLPREHIKGSDILPAARQAFQANTGLACLENAADGIADADVVILAVKPQVAESVVAALPPLKKDALVISICAGIQLRKLCNWFSSRKIIRVMPNTPLMVGKGASAFAIGEEVSSQEAEFARRLLSSAGLAYQVTEELLDSVTALSGSGPAYVFALAEAMAAAGVKAGLPEAMSMELTIQTIAGAAEMMARHLDTPEKLRIAVTSPHGTTEAGLNVMKAADFDGIIAHTVEAARKRSEELGK